MQNTYVLDPNPVTGMKTVSSLTKTKACTKTKVNQLTLQALLVNSHL